MTEPRQHAVAADQVFDGTVVHRNTAVLIEAGKVAAIVPRHELPPATPLHTLPAGAWLAPGFVDLQVNGGGDVLFNDSPTPETIATMAAAHRRFGTTSLLPTLITDHPDKMARALESVATAMTRTPGVLGVHLEGPFLSVAKAGVHDVRFIRRPTADDFRLLTAPRGGVLLVTLAPEEVQTDDIRRLAAAGARVALGHSMATYAQTRSAMAEGLRGFTHLFNAMRPMESREPGPIAAALECPDAWYGLIVDGMHVDPAMLRLALRGRGRPVLVTDAMPPVGGRQPSFRLYGEEIVVRDGCCRRRDGTLAGAMLDMATAVRNCVRLLGVDLTDALRFASANPAHALGLGDQLGRLAPGLRADLVAFEPEGIAVLDTWVAGQASS
jgi:N-acetylglucosamine-6-phosphate deacetylase